MEAAPWSWGLRLSSDGLEWATETTQPIAPMAAMAATVVTTPSARKSGRAAPPSLRRRRRCRWRRDMGKWGGRGWCPSRERRTREGDSTRPGAFLSPHAGFAQGAQGPGAQVALARKPLAGRRRVAHDDDPQPLVRGFRYSSSDAERRDGGQGLTLVGVGRQPDRDLGRDGL